MLVGQQIGPFEIEKELGSGAMGTVYRAKFNKGDKVVPVALKVVALGLLGNEGAMARFDREANILKQLRHTHIVRLYATGHYRKTPFIAMEYIDGEALDRVLARRGRLSWEEVVTYVKQLCGALQYAHEKGIIHRDLKPSNLMVTRDGTLKLTDFGIAKDTDVTALTGANSTIGTAAYMSPEQCKGDRNLTHKSDLYSLGIVFFELLTGRKPFTADNTVDMFLKHVNERPPRIGKIVQDLPPKLEAMVLQLLEKDKDNRPTDANWVERMLGEIEEDAFARKSAGLDAASARKIDRPRTGTDDAPTINAEDRAAARALKGTKKKKKKRVVVPFFERKAVHATGIVLLLVGMCVGAYFAFIRPPSAEKLYAPVAEAVDKIKKKEKVPADDRVEIAERYLKVHGDTPGEQTEAAAALFRQGKVMKREQQLGNRYTSKWKDKPEEADDPDAYSLTMLAMQLERGGDLTNAAGVWEKVKGKFPEEAKLPYTFDDEKLVKARWGWLADKKLKDIKDAQDELKQLAGRIDEARRFEKPIAYDATNPESVATKALRLERFGDYDKAARLWDTVITLTEKDLDQQKWFLLATDRRARAPKDAGDNAAGTRATLVRNAARAVEEQYKSLKANPQSRAEWIGLRSQCRELAELYDDEMGDLAESVKKARQILADAAKEQ